MFFQIGNIDAQYCEASAANSNYEWIESVRVFTRSNYSGSSSGYQDFTSNTPINLIAGACHNFEIQVGYSGTEYGEYYGIWIDYNNDEDFLDPGEKIFQTSSPNIGGIGFNIIIPTTAVLGQTRMRVIMNYSSLLLPCGDFNYGEVEDYTVNVLSADPICNSSGNNTSYEYIESVLVNGAEEVSGDNGGYHKNLCAPFYLNMGMVNNIELTPGYYSSSGEEYIEGWTIWIDYNKNDVFENNELVYKNPSGLGTISLNLEISNNTIPNEIYRMRISMQYNYYQLNSCANFNYGEVEDYVFVALNPLGIADFSEDLLSTRDYSAEERIPDSSKISISPNPASDFVQINTMNGWDISKSYRIISSGGKLMQDLSHHRSSDSPRIDTSNYPDGYYIIQIKTKDTWESIPFVVSH